MPILTMDDFERALERAKNRPPRTPEEIKRSEEFAKKMQNLSEEELMELLVPDDDEYLC